MKHNAMKVIFSTGLLIAALLYHSQVSAQENAEGLFLRTIAPLGDERGLCFDLVGWTPTNIRFDIPLNSHTCKHGWWNMDGRFDKAALNEGRLEMPYFDRCLEVSSEKIKTSAFSENPEYRLFARSCSRSKNQKFIHLDTGQIVLAHNPDLCISVPDTPLRDAGGDDFWLNGLILDTCSDEASDRQRWSFAQPH